jgi:hypothetical protein
MFVSEWLMKPFFAFIHPILWRLVAYFKIDKGRFAIMSWEFMVLTSQNLAYDLVVHYN